MFYIMLTPPVSVIEKPIYYSNVSTITPVVLSVIFILLGPGYLYYNTKLKRSLHNQYQETRYTTVQ
ncbi:protein O2 [Cercopithecine betaherpesvirus 5]|uniref:Protein O2 n=1 Tax=Simian cytomegalovirus (strain Colburn) TaxID=50292 RepID=G8XTQ1_SCMVC|nr:protein O2 [Cercopithecine betaherpesvirus 5]